MTHYSIQSILAILELERIQYKTDYYTNDFSQHKKSQVRAMNSSKKEANLEELRDRESNDTGLFVLLFFNFQHWLSQPAYYIAAWDQEQ